MLLPIGQALYFFCLSLYALAMVGPQAFNCEGREYIKACKPGWLPTSLLLTRTLGVALPVVLPAHGAAFPSLSSDPQTCFPSTDTHTYRLAAPEAVPKAQHKSAAFLPCVIACSLVDVVDYLFELEVCTDETKIMAFNFIEFAQE